MRIHEVILPPLASSNNKKITNNKEKTNQNLIMNRQIPCSYKNMEGYAIGVYKPPHQLHIAVAFQPFNDPYDIINYSSSGIWFILPCLWVVRKRNSPSTQPRLHFSPVTGDKKEPWTKHYVKRNIQCRDVKFIYKIPLFFTSVFWVFKRSHQKQQIANLSGLK